LPSTKKITLCKKKLSKAASLPSVQKKSANKVFTKCREKTLSLSSEKKPSTKQVFTEYFFGTRQNHILKHKMTSNEKVFNYKAVTLLKTYKVYFGHFFK